MTRDLNANANRRRLVSSCGIAAGDPDPTVSLGL
jgi:hypothetical protein